ncbi:hypothetical protein I350_07220 [Cryptococcus amylolentus CBS 6273]|uniref:3-oxoacyl-[acyl-carrier protein] reductase n=1 Tax=Cryptococcus amylolentus CBS 6273 TaxID=1296118 RepID=A0A1E3JEG3_9TREE|nr:hypothetical protein I350_07220 [Cryptococcus amylolentus CBS 6273]
MADHHIQVNAEALAAQRVASILSLRDSVLNDIQKTSSSNVGAELLADKVGVITGVDSDIGIGAASLATFAREGARHIYLVDWQKRHILAIIETIKTRFPNTTLTLIEGDAADAPFVKSVIDRVINDEGHLDFFFANSGVMELPGKEKEERIDDDPGKFLPELWADVFETSEEDFLAYMRINAARQASSSPLQAYLVLTHLPCSKFIALKYASKAMSLTCPERGKTLPGGSILLTSSTAGVKARAGPLAYSASNASIVSFAQTGSYEFAGRNVRVNAICPGLIQTEMTAPFLVPNLHGDSGTPAEGMMNPSLRHGLAHEVAEVAVFLSSSKASYINGQAINIDGGWTAGNPFMPRPM